MTTEYGAEYITKSQRVNSYLSRFLVFCAIFCTAQGSDYRLHKDGSNWCCDRSKTSGPKIWTRHRLSWKG